MTSWCLPFRNASSKNRYYATTNNECSHMLAASLKNKLKGVDVPVLYPLREFVLLYSEEFDTNLLTNIKDEMLNIYNTLRLEVPKIKGDEFEVLKKKLVDLRSELFSGDLHAQSHANRVMLQVKAGVGGDESARFAKEVFEMYKTISGDRGFLFRTVDNESAQIVGGTDFFKYEFGVHRLQRIPLNCKKIQTSSAIVTVVPHIHSDGTEIKPSDLAIETMRSRGAGGQSVNKSETAVRITHLPTGVSVLVQDTGSQITNKSRALRLIAGKIEKDRISCVEKVKSQTKLSQFKTGDRSEKIRTFQFVRDCVVDHRCNVVIPGVKPFMKSGDGIEKIHSSLKAIEDFKLMEFVAANIEIVAKFFTAKHINIRREHV
ncbi:peptide chain release factor 1 [Babesia caballi]|uniref:Peptide chain release factor 1 n=1 Tax=Babesia caballi TaxID=5871 RepID=A0AAV4M0B1_BABCB|nr:peptide chain release factor 1 [Babesia caballi]